MTSGDEVLYWASPRQEGHEIVRISESKSDANEKNINTTLETVGRCSTCAQRLTKHSSRRIKRLRHPTDSILFVNFMRFNFIFLVHAVLFAVCFPLLVAIIPIAFLVRKLIVFFGSRSRDCRVQETQRKMALGDAMWLDKTGENPAIFSTIFLLLEGEITVDEVRQMVADQWLHYCGLKGTYTFPKLLEFGVEFTGGYAWRKIENFQLEEYVHQFEKSTLSTNDINENRTDLSYLVPTVEPEKALWRIIVFPRLNELGDSGIFLQVHNSVADIFPVVRLTLESFGYKTVDLKNSCFNLKRKCLYLCAALVGPLCVLKRLFMRKDTGPLCCCGNQSLNRSSDKDKRIFWSGRVDMKVVKRIKDITRTKVDVVIVSCLAGALRSYMRMCGVDHPSDIRACLQLDVRPQHSGLRLNNQFAPVFVKLPVGTEGAVPRLWETRRRMSTLGCVLEKVILWGFTKLCSVLLPARVVRSLVEFLIGKSSCTVTYVPGPTAPLYLNGKMAKLMTVWSPRPGKSGLSLSITTHGHQLRLGMISSTENTNDPKLLLLEFEKEVVKLALHLGSRTLPSHLRMRAKAVRASKNEDTEPV